MAQEDSCMYLACGFCLTKNGQCGFPVVVGISIALILTRLSAPVKITNVTLHHAERILADCLANDVLWICIAAPATLQLRGGRQKCTAPDTPICKTIGARAEMPAPTNFV